MKELKLPLPCRGRPLPVYGRDGPLMVNAYNCMDHNRLMFYKIFSESLRREWKVFDWPVDRGGFNLLRL